MHNIDRTIEQFASGNSSFILNDEPYILGNSLLNNNTEGSFSNQADYLELSAFEQTNNLDNSTKELVFIDSNVADSNTLIDRLSGAAEVIVLNSNTDGLLQINDALNQYEDIDAVHVVSHGDTGKLSLGNTQINQDNLSQYEEILTTWEESLTEDADILFYGCDVASNQEGVAFLEKFGQLTNADIMASNDATGSSILNGNWNLEVAIGNIETEIAFDSTVKDAYQHILFFNSPVFNSPNPDGFDWSDWSDWEDLPELSFADTILTSGTFEAAFINNPNNFDFFRIDGSSISFTNIDNLDLDTISVDSIDGGTIKYEIFDVNGEIVIVETDFTTYEPIEEVYNFLNDPNDFYFSDEFYLNNYPELANTNVDPFEHYMSTGWQEGKNPSLYFHTHFYLHMYPEVIDSGMNPFEHFNTIGWKEGKDPSAYFDTSYYLESEANRDVLDANINPLEHFQNTGWREGRNPNPFFDTKFYLASNPDATNDGMNPLEHYIAIGADRGELPSPFFDGDYYLEKNIDVANSGMNPLEHYLTSGQTEGRKSSIVFESPNQVLIAQSVWDDVGTYLNPLTWIIVGGVLVYEFAEGTVEFVGDVAESVFFTPDTGTIPTTIPPFPNETEATIKIEVFPGADINTILENNTFKFPVDVNDNDYYIFPTEDGIIESILNKPFTFPNQNIEFPYYTQINTGDDGFWDDVERDLAGLNQYDNFDTGSWIEGSYSDVYTSIEAHYGKHGEELMINSPEEYVERSEIFKEQVLSQGIEGDPVSGRTPNTRRYVLGSEYIDLALIDGVYRTVSYGSIFDLN